MNNINILKEQVLLRIYEDQNISIEKIKDFFEKTYFWHEIKNKIEKKNVPIDQLLMINEISLLNIHKLHSDPKKVIYLRSSRKLPVKISKLTNSSIFGYIKTDYGLYSCQFDIETGIKCSCGFVNEISDNYADHQFSFEFCDHVTSFLLHLIDIPDKNLQKYVEDIIPKTVKNQYILNYLFEKGLIIKNEDNTVKCSQFGKLIIRLYLYPVSGVIIRQKLEDNERGDLTFKGLIKDAYEVLLAEHRVRDYKLLEPIIEWTDEEALEKILERFKIMPGDLNSVRENLERIITFIGIIANHLSLSGTEQDKMIRIAEISETLKLRLHYDIREELFDLVLRIENVGRIRARILYNAGYHTTSQIAKESPYILNRKTGLGITICKKIHESLINKKSKKMNF